MDFFKNLYEFQRRAARHHLKASDRLVYINLLIRADLEHTEDFDMTLDELATFTGLPRTTVQDAKARLKKNGLIDFKRSHITVGQIPDEKPNIVAQRNTPTPPKKKNTFQNACQNRTHEGDEGFSITYAPEWK